jgi:hypothetical protein
LLGLDIGGAAETPGIRSSIEDRDTSVDSNEYESDRETEGEDEGDRETESEDEGDRETESEDEGDRETEDEDEDEDEEDEQNRYLAETRMKAEKFEREKEVEVQEAYSALEAALKTSRTVPIGPIDGGEWDLYSTEYLSHYFDEVHLGKRLRLGKLYDNFGDIIPGAICEPGQVSAELHIYPEGHLDIYPFDPPTQASLEPVIVKSWQNHEVELIFLGNAYLKLRVELDVLMKGKPAQRHNREPKMIEFSGTWISDEERRRQRQEFIRSHRPPSPGDSIAFSFCGWQW